MIPYQLIRRKRDGQELEPAELRAFLRAYAEERLPDYQMSALLMAACLRGLTHSELTTLVEEILASGVVLDLSSLSAPRIDKHSTGGVGDKTSLILAPLVAALDVVVPMMSGRGLGHTGGTVDKLESIPGFRTNLSLAEFRRQLERIGCALITQTPEIAPLDGKLYGLRDVTGTVESIPLIASSIMSKKIAEGIDGLVLDIKRGNGAFLPALEDDIELARTMIGIGQAYGRNVVALITAMDRPLGCAIGNALEMEEAILTLHGGGPPDVRELTVALAVEMIQLARGGEADVVRQEVEAALADGRALDRMRLIIEAQGGNPAVLDDPALLPHAPVQHVVRARSGGVISRIDVRRLGDAAVALGAGRATLHSMINHAVGLFVTVKPGDVVEPDQPLATIHATGAAYAEGAAHEVQESLVIAAQGEPALPLISHRVTAERVEVLHT